MSLVCGQGGDCPVPVGLSPPCEPFYLSGGKLPLECPKGGIVKQAAVAKIEGRFYADPTKMENGECAVHKRNPAHTCPFWTPEREELISCSTCSNGPGANGN